MTHFGYPKQFTPSQTMKQPFPRIFTLSAAFFPMLSAAFPMLSAASAQASPHQRRPKPARPAPQGQEVQVEGIVGGVVDRLPAEAEEKRRQAQEDAQPLDGKPSP